MASKDNNDTHKSGLFLKGKMDYSIILIVLILLICGIIILISASGPISLKEVGNTYSYVKKQIFYIIIGFVGMFIVSKIDYRFFKRHRIITSLIYILTLAILAYVGLKGKEVKGARRWLEFGGNTFQPSEFAKVSFIIFYAIVLSNIYDAGKIKRIVPGYILPLASFIPTLFIMYKLQNHMSCTAFMGLILVAQMFIAGSGLIKFALSGGAGALAIWLYTKFVPAAKRSFRMGRIDTWRHFAEADTKGGAYQINQSLYAIASGGMFGQGPGQSIQKYSYLPEAQNDFIFSIFAEEFGFVGCTVVIALFALFVWRGVTIALKANDMSGTLIAIGVTVLIGVEAAMNIAVVTNTGPVTGVLLPFFSYGGSGMIANLVAVGFLLAVSRNSKIKEKKKGKEDD